MVRIELFMGEAGQELYWRPGFCGEEVVQRKLGGGDDNEAFSQVEVV